MTQCLANTPYSIARNQNCLSNSHCARRFPFSHSRQSSLWARFLKQCRDRVGHQRGRHPVIRIQVQVSPITCCPRGDSLCPDRCCATVSDLLDANPRTKNKIINYSSLLDSTTCVSPNRYGVAVASTNLLTATPTVVCLATTTTQSASYSSLLPSAALRH